MCLIVHKPAESRIPQDLLEAALALNSDGWGLMGFSAEGRLLLERHAGTDAAKIRATVAAHPRADLVLHLRQRTRGCADGGNAHPFKVAEGLYLMHNGTLPMASRVAGRSDTWHLVNDLLRPLHGRHPGLLADRAFLSLLELSLRPDNKLVLLDEQRRRIAIINHAQGADFEGLWLSNTRWIDRRRLPLADPPQPQQRSYRADQLLFV